MLFNISFRVGDCTKRDYLCTRYPENNLFTLKTNTYQKVKGVLLCEERHFLVQIREI